jgi:hypothetical protein
MNKDLAKKIIEALACAEVPLQEIDTLISNIEEDERKKLIGIFGQLVSSHSELLAHIKKQFPELDPEGEGKDLYERAKNQHGSKYS